MSRTVSTEINAYVSPYGSSVADVLGREDVSQSLLYTIIDIAPSGYTLVGRGTVTVELFDTDTLVGAEIAALREQAQSIRSQTQVQLNEIEDKIRNLQALTYEPA